MKIILYTISNCPFCKQAKDFFTSKNIQYEEKNVETNREFLSEMLSSSGDFAGVPFTVIQKDDGSKSFLKGFTQEEFEKELASVAVPVVEVAQAVNIPNIPSPQDVNIPNVDFANENQKMPDLPPIDLPTSQPGVAESIPPIQPTVEKVPEPKIEEVAQTINIPTPSPVIADVPVVPTPTVEPTVPVSNVPSPEPVQIETPTESIQQPQPTVEKVPEPKIEEVAQTINIPTPSPVIADVPVAPTPAVEPTVPVSNIPSPEPVKLPEEKKDDINDELKNVLSSLENMTSSEEEKKDDSTSQQGPLS